MFRFHFRRMRTTPDYHQKKNVRANLGIPLDEQVGIALRNAVPEVQQAAMSRSMADTSNPQAVLMKRIQQLSVEITGSTQKPAQGMPVNLRNAEKSAGFAKDTCVVLKNLFKPAEVDLDAEPDFYEEIKDDVAESGRRPSGAAS